MTDKMTPTDDPSEDILKEYGDADGELSDQDNVALIGEAYAKMREQISKMIIGQDEVVENLLTCIFAGGHCLLVGVPGHQLVAACHSLERLLGSRGEDN